MKRLLLILLAVCAAAALASEIEEVGHNASDGLHPGQLLVVELEAKAGRRPTLELPGIAYGLLMHEIEPGHYRGRFLVLDSMTPYEAEPVIRYPDPRESQTLEPVKFLPAAQPARSRSTTDRDGHLCLAFDRSIQANTVEVDTPQGVLTFPEDLELENNFFVSRHAVESVRSVSVEDLDGHNLEMKEEQLSYEAP